MPEIRHVFRPLENLKPLAAQGLSAFRPQNLPTGSPEEPKKSSSIRARAKEELALRHSVNRIRNALLELERLAGREILDTAETKRGLSLDCVSPMGAHTTVITTLRQGQSEKLAIEVLPGAESFAVGFFDEEDRNLHSNKQFVKTEAEAVAWVIRVGKLPVLKM